MKLHAINSMNSKALPAFGSSVQKRYGENPISESMEKVNLMRATFLAGLGVGARLLYAVFDSKFVMEHIWTKGTKLAEKNAKHAKTDLAKAGLYVGSWLALTAAFVGFVAFVYTLFNSPKDMYEGKINAFKKTKDMDAYIVGNKVQKELYNQMNDQAKNATTDEKNQLKQQYFKLKAAKNDVPEFVNLNRS